jgi:hypothetical protein
MSIKGIWAFVKLKKFTGFADTDNQRYKRALFTGGEKPLRG